MNKSHTPSLLVSLVPVMLLLAALIMFIAVKGADSVQDYSYWILLSASAVALILSRLCAKRPWRVIWFGMCKSARQIMPAIPILIFIGTLSSTWMLSGVVPMLIDYGLRLLDPGIFLMLSCLICAIVSVVTGSSWTIIATIGVALMGIGTVMGYSPAWTAGAIISGAYFGDKVSPLSDTTVLAASSTGVGLFAHIRFLMLTTIPALAIALIVFSVAGVDTDVYYESHTAEMVDALDATFNMSPWLFAVPLLTGLLIVLRVRTDVTLAISSLVALAAIFIFQPQVIESLSGGAAGWIDDVMVSLKILAVDTSLESGNELLDSLVATGGIAGMLPTVYLVLSAMAFGGVMIGTGMLSAITAAFTHRLSSPRSLVGATVGSGLFLNCCTGDQYLSIIIGGNVFKNTYKRNKMRPQVLSRALEDSISVTSVLIPWNSCGVTQSTVLGVATLTYLPYCVFNYVSPLMSVAMAWIGWKMLAASPMRRKLAVD